MSGDVAHPFRMQVRIYFEDTDAGGHVYHARFLHFAERARTELLRAVGAPHVQMVNEFGAMFVVRRVEMEYFRPARLDDELTVTAEALDYRAARVRMRQDFRLIDPSTGKEERVAELLVTLACVRLRDGRPIPIPPPWRTALDRSSASGPHS